MDWATEPPAHASPRDGDDVGDDLIARRGVVARGSEAGGIDVATAAVAPGHRAHVDRALGAQADTQLAGRRRLEHHHGTDLAGGERHVDQAVGVLVGRAGPGEQLVVHGETATLPLPVTRIASSTAPAPPPSTACWRPAAAQSRHWMPPMTLLDTLLQPFQLEFMRYALIISVLVAIPTALLSCFLVLKGWSLMGDAISHAVFPAS